MTYLETVAQTINSLMKNNSKCIYLGEDVKSGQRGISDGFIKRFGKHRVIDTPISESAFTGLALGLAISNYRPIVEFNFAGLIYVCLDQIFNQASKFKKMSGNKKDVPIIYILPTGTKGGLAGHHSDNPYSTLTHLGIKCYMPCLIQEIKPIINYAYSLKEPVAIFLPVEEFRNNKKLVTQNIKYPGINKIKLTKSEKNKKLTLITTGTSLSKCLNAINSLDLNHKSKIDLYSFSDLSMSIGTRKKIQKLKSNNFLIVDDSPGEFGICSELELVLRRKMRKYNINIKTISRISNFIAFNQKEEDRVRPTEKKIQKKLIEMLK